MVPFVAAQVQAIIEGIRLLESFVTAPLGLHSDIKMLRESLHLPEAADLSREEQRARRTAFMTLTDTPLELALGAISSLSSSLDMLETTKGDDGSPLDPSWVAQARRVLVRAQQRVAGDMRAKAASGIQGLYVIVDPDATNGRPILEVAEATLRGGVSVLQLRDKAHGKGEILPVARQLKSMCHQAGALFIMNDDADLALASDANGLHVGQGDLPVAQARRVLAPQQIVGRSNNTVAEAMDSQAQGADYIAVGAIYATSTMGKDSSTAVGAGMVSKIKELVSQPVVAIGGINPENIADVARAGADCVCVVSAVTLANDPQAATQELVEAIRNAK